MEDINAYWHRCDNFGDALTPYILTRLTGKNVVYNDPSPDIVTYMITGSMLDDDITNSIVWGCGIAWRNDQIRKPYRIDAVRGPISRERVIECGYKCPDVYGDPGLILPKLYQPESNIKYNLGIIPHYTDFELANSRYGMIDSIKVINLLDPVEKIIDEICSCNVTVSSSLHGLVVSQAYNKPNLWVEFSNNVIGDGTKFNDYFLSIGIEPYKPLNLRDYAEHTILLNNIKEHDTHMDKTIKQLMAACPCLCDYPYTSKIKEKLIKDIQ